MFFYRLLTRAVQEAWKAMQEAAEAGTERAGTRALGITYGVDVGGVAEALRKVEGQVLTVRESIKAVQQAMLQDQGEFVDQYDELWTAASVAAVTAGDEAIEVFKSLVEGLREGSGEVIDSATAIFHVESALARYALATGRTVDELERAEAQQVIYNQVMGRTDELLDAGAREALEQAEAVDDLTSAWQDFRGVFGAILAASPALETMAEALRQITIWTALIASFSAQMEANFSKMLKGDFDQWGRWFQTMWGPFLGPLAIIPSAIAAAVAPGEEYEETFRRMTEAMGLFRDEVDKTFDADNFRMPDVTDLSSIVDHLMKREDIMQKHADKMEDIERSYQDRVEDIWLNWRTNRNRIMRKADMDAERARRRTSRRREREEEEHRLKLEHNLEDHLQRLQHMEQQYRMRAVHDEALYQYERGVLVAEGDVLAIDDLDARHELEKKSNQDNFNLQQRQREEAFQQQQRQLEESFQLQMKYMETALRDQLETIRLSEQERLRENDERRKEDLQKARQDYQQRKEDEAEHLADSLRKWGEYWVELAKKTNLSSQQIARILRGVFGPGGQADIIMQQYFLRQQRRAQLLMQVTALLGEGSTRPNNIPVGPGYQYGGHGVVDRPTWIKVGEGHMPERYSVSPMSPIGGNIGLSWQGGGIPIQGTGDLSGVNLSEVGDAIAQGIVVSLEQQMFGGG
jgi:hypothetical protein